MVENNKLQPSFLNLGKWVLKMRKEQGNALIFFGPFLHQGKKEHEALSCCDSISIEYGLRDCLIRRISDFCFSRNI